MEKLRALDGTVELTVPVGAAPNDVIFDGTYIWVANPGDNSISKIRTDGTVVEEFFAGRHPSNLVSDGAKIWVTNPIVDTVTVLRASNGKPKGIVQVSGESGGIAVNGSNVWLANTEDDTVTRLRAKDGSENGISRRQRASWRSLRWR